jgi:hypothetical protein
MTLSNWQLGDDCLIEYSPKGVPKHLVPFSQIATIEIADND